MVLLREDPPRLPPPTLLVEFDTLRAPLLPLDSLSAFDIKSEEVPLVPLTAAATLELELLEEEELDALVELTELLLVWRMRVPPPPASRV